MKIKNILLGSMLSLAVMASIPPQVDAALLHSAACNDNVEKIQQLLQAPEVDVNAPNDYGWTALVLASYCNNAHIVQQLLQYPSINVNATVAGWTALMHAARWGYQDIVELLLQHPNIDVYVTDKARGTALDLATTDEIKKSIQKHIDDRTAATLRGYKIKSAANRVS